MATASLALGEDVTRREVQGGKQRGGPVANVLVGDVLDATESQRTHGLRAIEGLGLRVSSMLRTIA